MKIFDQPLAERMRPKTLEQYMGQVQLLGHGKILRKLIESAKQNPQITLPSMVFWGPPGSGKTTLARLLSQYIDAHFESFSAISNGVKEARVLIEDAKQRKQLQQQKTILFVDEIHRFNKSQQDTFLPAVENGTIILVGATTENPSFELNSALLSRMKVFVLEPLTEEHILKLVVNALESEQGLLSYQITYNESALKILAQHSHGDARTALNTLELAVNSLRLQNQEQLTDDHVLEALQKNAILYDKTGEEHFNLISALHKSVRHSDANAALYYLGRMLEGGEDPLYIARRLVRIASEDIGLADPQALSQALAAKEAAEFLGIPECDTALAQACIYLACAPKSNSTYTAIKAVRSEIKQSGPLAVPLHYRNASTSLMKQLGYGKDYQYDHDSALGVSNQDPFPKELKQRNFYQSNDIGFEKEIQKRIDYFNKLKIKAKEFDSNV